MTDEQQLEKELRENKSAFGWIATHLTGPQPSIGQIVSYARLNEHRIADLLDELAEKRQDG